MYGVPPLGGSPEQDRNLEAQGVVFPGLPAGLCVVSSSSACSLAPGPYVCSRARAGGEGQPQKEESAPAAVTESPDEGLVFTVMKLELMRLAGEFLSNGDQAA